MKNICMCLTVIGSILALAAGSVGCGDSDDNGGSSSRVTASYDKFCNYLLDCREEDGDEFDREQICPAFDGLIEAGRFLGPACERAVADYFDCLTEEPCGTDDSACEAPGEGQNTACGSAP